MRLAFKILAMIAYVVVGTWLESRAYQHLKNPQADLLDPPLVKPEKFLAGGEVHRRRAIDFWIWAGVLTAVLIFGL